VFQKKEEGNEKPLIDGVFLRVRAFGEKTLMGEFRLEKGAQVPVHAHPHEQTGILLSGRLRFTVGGETIDAGPGDTWCITGGVPHSAEALEESVAVEVFSPVREDYL
jgi:quercetin dioxygenase-like cupin family protein